MRYRLVAGSPGYGGRSCHLPAIKRITPIAGLLMMVRHKLRVTLDRIGAKLDQGNRNLAVSYAVHVLDLYEHYLMRARLEEKIRQDIKDGKLKSYEEAAAHVVPHGLLSLTDAWQKVKLESKGPSSMSYFLANA